MLDVIMSFLLYFFSEHILFDMLSNKEAKR